MEESKKLKMVANGFLGNSYLSIGTPDSTKCIRVSNSFQRHRKATDSPYKLISSTHCKLVSIGRIYIDCIQPHFLLFLFCHHQLPLRVEKHKSYILPKIQMVMASDSRESNVCFEHKTKSHSHIFTKCYFGDGKKM